ncbi:hypothetical protein AgCh_024192 [Apium graveolens]
MCTSALLVGESKEEVNAPQFMDFAIADQLDSVYLFFTSSLQVLGEDTDPIAICQWSVSTSPGLINLDASADSGSDIDSSDESNKDRDLRTPIAPPVTSLRMAKVIFLTGTARFWSYERSDTLVRMSVNTSGEKSEILVRKNEDKVNTKNQKIRRKPEVCLQGDLRINSINDAWKAESDKIPDLELMEVDEVLLEFVMYEPLELLRGMK